MLVTKMIASCCSAALRDLLPTWPVLRTPVQPPKQDCLCRGYHRAHTLVLCASSKYIDSTSLRKCIICTGKVLCGKIIMSRYLKDL